MPRRIFFEKNKPFHIISRAIEEKRIFGNESDCYRFIFQLYAANVGRPSFNLRRKDTTKAAQSLLRGEEVPPKFIVKEHPPFVYILDFSLVGNHYHFYLVPNLENTVPLFMKKLNGGFAKYFNLRYSRRDSLFGSRYKSIPIKTDFQSDAVSRYINTINPLDVYQPSWREKGLKNWQKALSFLENYQFSSFPDKIGKRESKIIAPRKILEKYSTKTDSKSKNDYREFIKDFLKQKLASISQFFLE